MTDMSHKFVYRLPNNCHMKTSLKTNTLFHIAAFILITIAVRVS